MTKVFQFKITLKGITPAIYRKIQIVNSCTFWDLHVAIQDSMGWLDYHLHNFEVLNPITNALENITICSEDDEKLSSEKKVKDYIDKNNNKMLYLYDFGDCWEHNIKLEKILNKENKKYPICIDGKRCCPPEDVGGIYGYKNFLTILKNPNHPEYPKTIEWSGEFNPEYFDIQNVKFDNPKTRLKNSISHSQI
ncbi:plasmid pRiA4b ORF-3 family protein [archaeon]|jgi:hypothetical protein|nr:plasmid pRiA4b ORF-3 family protein [archaeon]